ncbi:hypothetical protein [Pimelobacter simplex]|uniref:hypothetical protein n=1 Tax=Nocardioides simplex TaxID=2045 RepID=UPI0021505468|nr:hypothetical protein [Pimelobacter simplex]UUW88947.1 hypothetical protein M0M43_24880 [Pimelobacter simplex]UUW98452.1 hypothetical protein M0M48_13530 [Pimelobacter simplex]
MTEKLKTLMDRAADVDFAAVDLTAVFEDGDRAVQRRRRGMSALAGVAAVVLVAGGIALATGGGDKHGRDRVPVVTTPQVTDPTWIVGQVLHSPTQQVDLGADVRTYVQTSAGFAFLATDGRVLGYRGGAVETLGRAWAEGSGDRDAQVRLVADPRAGLVGWVDATSPDAPGFVVHDLTTGAEQVLGQQSSNRRAVAEFFAIDDGTAYWLDGRGTVATDLASGDARVLADFQHLQWIADVRQGLRVQLVESPDGGDQGMELVDADGRALISYRDLGSPGVLSPAGTWVAAADAGTVWNVADRQAVPLVPPSGAAAREVRGYQWLDDSTLLAVVEEKDDSTDLVRCAVPAGTCTPVATGLDFETLVLPGIMVG